MRAAGGANISGHGRRVGGLLAWGGLCLACTLLAHLYLRPVTSPLFHFAPHHPPAPFLTHSAGTGRGEMGRGKKCAVLYRGAGCREVAEGLPACVQGVFSGWWSVHQAVLPPSPNNTLNVPNLPSKSPGNGPGARAKRAVQMKKLSQSMSRARAMEQVLTEAFEAKKEIRHLEIPESLRALLPETDLLGLTWNNSTRGEAIYRKCAVVSSAASLLDTEWGPRINNHDLVLRFNNAPVTGYEKHVGNFTSLRMTNSQYEGVREFTGEPVLGKWAGDMEGLERMVRKKIHPLNTAFRHYAQPMAFSLAGHMHTTGLLGLLVLMHHCQQVSTFGFTGDRLEEWYYNKRPKGSIPKKEWLRTASWEVGGDTANKASSTSPANNSAVSVQSSGSSTVTDGTDNSDAGAGAGFPTLGRGRNLRRYDALTNGLAEQPVKPNSKKGKALVIGAGAAASVEEMRAVVEVQRAAQEERKRQAETSKQMVTGRPLQLLHTRLHNSGTQWVMSSSTKTTGARIFPTSEMNRAFKDGTPRPTDRHRTTERERASGSEAEAKRRQRAARGTGKEDVDKQPAQETRREGRERRRVRGSGNIQVEAPKSSGRIRISSRTSGEQTRAGRLAKPDGAGALVQLSHVKESGPDVEERSAREAEAMEGTTSFFQRLMRDSDSNPLLAELVTLEDDLPRSNELELPTSPNEKNENQWNSNDENNYTATNIYQDVSVKNNGNLPNYISEADKVEFSQGLTGQVLGTDLEEDHVELPQDGEDLNRKDAGSLIDSFRVNGLEDVGTGAETEKGDLLQSGFGSQSNDEHRTSDVTGLENIMNPENKHLIGWDPQANSDQQNTLEKDLHEAEGKENGATDDLKESLARRILSYEQSVVQDYRQKDANQNRNMQIEHVSEASSNVLEIFSRFLKTLVTNYKFYVSRCVSRIRYQTSFKCNLEVGMHSKEAFPKSVQASKSTFHHKHDTFFRKSENRKEFLSDNSREMHILAHLPNTRLNKVHMPDMVANPSKHRRRLLHIVRLERDCMNELHDRGFIKLQ